MKKSLFITLIVFIVILVTTNLFLLSHYNKCSCSVKEHNEKNEVECKCYVSETLKLDENQSMKYELIKKKHQSIASKITDSLHVTQEAMMDYLSSSENDRAKTDYFEDKISGFQKALLEQSVEQFKELKAILKPEQIKPANDLFRGLFVCRPTCSHRQNNCEHQGEKH